MNYNKHTFSVEEFLAIPVFEETRLAPIGVSFILDGRFSRQKEFLLELVKEHTEEGIRKKIEEETRKNPKKDHRIKVNFWRKYKDGNVGEFGGTINFGKDELVLKNDKLIFNVGDDNLTFKYDDGRTINEPRFVDDPVGG